MAAYIRLAQQAVDARKLRWPARPKFHVPLKSWHLFSKKLVPQEIFHISLSVQFTFEIYIYPGLAGNPSSRGDWEKLNCIHVGFPTKVCFWRDIGCLYFYLYVLAVWGQNSRHYHGFRCEDFVGRIATLAQQCSKNALESAILPRFYSGFLGCIRVCLIASFQRASKQGFMQLRLHQHHSHVAGAGQWLMDLASLSGVLLDTLVN